MATTDPTPSLAGRLSSEAAGERLSELFEEHGRMVYGICRLLLRDADEAEDAAQQVFLSAHRSMLGGTQPREPAAWLGTIARNECHARIRERMSTPLALVVDDHDVVVPGVEHVAGERAEIQALCAAIAELPQQQREALVLREFYGLSYDEVRAALGLSDGAVESLLFRARKRLQTELRPARVASGALALPLALRDSIAAVVPGFASTSSTAGGLAKLASVPLFAKLAAAAATLTVASGIGYVEVSARDHVAVVPPAAAEHRAAAAAEEPAQLERVSFVQPALVEPSQPGDDDGARHERKIAKGTPTESEDEDRGDAGEVEGDSDEQGSAQSDDADADDGGGGTEADSDEDGSGSGGSGASTDGSDRAADGSDGAAGDSDGQ